MRHLGNPQTTMKLLIASHNPAKVGEYKKMLADLPLGIVSLADLNIKEEAPEDAETFEANAIAKVKFYHQLTGLPVIGDDGGLQIDALNGAPGVKSRRWLGYRMTDEEMISSVMKKMRGVPDNQRTAHLVGIVALVMYDDQIHTQWAQIDGIIAQQPTDKRLDGYPYRSFFYLPQFKKFYLELTEAEHEQINHRKFALEKLKPYLEKVTD
jgi:XTP/dITP diphosphohydrolase